MIRRTLLITVSFLLAACSATSGPVKQPNDREWNLLTADYAWIDTLRKAQPVPPAGATRKQQIETVLDSDRKLEPTYRAFMDKLSEYYERTGDPRAAQVMAREKIVMGDQFMTVLARYDRAIDFYRQALQFDPNSAEAKERIALAESRRFVPMTAFAEVKSGMKEEDVRRLVGIPREDWIKQVVQNNRVYSVWIYPKSDGGASAVYFDNGVVYHTNWNAAAPPAAPAK